MKEIISIILILCVSVSIYLYIGIFFKKNDTTRIRETFNSDPVLFIPQTIMITTPDKDTVPKYIWDQYDKYAIEYKLNVYDDDECRHFLLQHYGPAFVKKFNELKMGAHKADLFRYAYLYVHGGVYLDVKTKLNRPLKTIFRHDINRCYLVKSINNSTIYNGIIATPAKNPYMRQLLYKMMERSDFTDYIINTKDAYSVLKEQLVDTDTIRTGLNKTSINEMPIFEVFQEINNKNLCEGKFDRYNFCVAIFDNKDNLLFYTRDHNYRKTWK